jgi:flavin reductase (DIM6/NTAB) family NADH-FMN oxidoreductase RutF
LARPFSVTNPKIDTRQFRNALGRFASGVTVLTAEHEGQMHGMTANAFVSVSLDPPLILVSLDNRSNMHRILPTVRRFGVSVLAEDQDSLSNHFAGRPVPGQHVRVVHRNGLPLIGGAVAYFVVEVADIHPAGDHTLYIGRVEHFEANEGRPLLFFGGRYHHMREEKGKPTQWPEDEFSLFSIGSVDPPVT